MLRNVFLPVLLAAGLTLPLRAQFDTATVLGTVRDSTSSVVPGADMVLLNQETGIKAKTVSDENGNYLFTNVRIGLYKVTAAKAGFAIASADGVRVVVNARQRVDLTLALTQVSESVQVSAAVAAVESDSSDRGQVISSRQIVDLPLNGRNYADLALLATGVRRSDYAVANPPREASFNVNGQRSIFNNFLMDGIDNNAYGTSNQGFSNQVVQLTPDAVGEFKVVTANASAEYGRSSGAVINATMKSGTNQFHGSAWEYVRNTELNATGFFRPANGKPVFQRNQFGFTAGGPIVKNRAFFFANYEGFRERQKFVVFSSLPTLNDRAGIFSVPVRNPLTGETYPADTPIPASAVSPFARKVLDQLPLPNAGSPTSASNNYRNLRADKNNNDKMDLKLDGEVTSKSTAFVRLSHRKSNYFQAPEIPGPSGGGGNGYIRVLNQQIGSGYTYTVTPNTLLEARFGVSRTRAGKEPAALGGPSMLALYGITGLSTDPALTGGLTPQAVSGFTTFGRQATNPQWQHPLVFNPKVNLSFFRGRHSMKTGYEYQRIHTEVEDVNPLYGNDIYSGQFSKPAGGTGSAGTYNLTDFLLGTRSEYQLVNFFVANYRQVMNYAYFQDDFKVSPKLTLNLGVRNEYATPQWEADNRLSNFDPASNKLIPAKDGSIADRAQVNPDRNNFAPRVGLAYSINPKTVIRSAYGISYIHFNRAGGGNLLAINGPQVVNAAIAVGSVTDPNFRLTQQGYPAGFTDSSKFDPLKANISYIPRDSPTGYVQNWSFSIQRELPWGFVTDIGYVGNKSTHLIIFADYNEARPLRPGETIQSAPLLSRRPDPLFSAITVTLPVANANYHALQWRLERRFSGGFSILNSFVWSKAIDTTGQALEAQAGSGGRSSPQTITNLAAERAVSDFDQPFNNTTAIVYQLPFGRARKFGGSMPLIADYLVGGWQVSAINTLWSGQPVNLSYNPNASQQVSISIPDWRGGNSYRPNVTGPVMVDSAQRTIDNYLNPATVVVPTDVTQPFGNAGRNIARRPGLAQADIAVEKSFAFPWREGMALQFRVEAFNAFNRTNFGNPGANRSAAGFGQIRQAFVARQLQFALRFVF